MSFKMLLARLRYLAVEIPRRLTRRALCYAFGAPAWHVASAPNKPYVGEVAAFVQNRHPQSVVEVGCGFCDILGLIQAPRRKGYDSDPRVLRAARIYLALTRSEIELGRLDFLLETLPPESANVWLLINWLHEYSPHMAERPLRRLFEMLPPGGMVILDSVSDPTYRFHHDPLKLFEGLSCLVETVCREPARQRTVYCVTKMA